MLDVGSNTVHLLVVDAHPGAAPIPAASHKEQLRLAEFITADGAIDPDGVARLLRFVVEAREHADDAGVGSMIAFATSAIRDATNGEDVLGRMRDAAGIDVQVLDGVDEARMTFLAVRRWFGWSSGRLLVVDIGGGSLEIAGGADEDPAVALSLPLGAGRLTRQFTPSAPAVRTDVKSLRRFVRTEIAGVMGAVVREGDFRHSVATSKSFKQLARITGAAPSSEGPFAPRVLRRRDLVEWVPRLTEMTVEQRSALPGVSAGRAPQLLAAAVVAEAVFDLFELDELEICPWALREGLILRYLDSMGSRA